MLAASCAIVVGVKKSRCVVAWLCQLEAVVTGHHCPRYSRRLVRKSDCRHAHVAALHQGFDPQTVPVITTADEAHHRPRSLNQLGAEIGVAVFRGAA